MAKQLEFKFDDKSETLKKLEKEIPDFRKNGFKTKEEYHKAILFDREWERMNKSIQAELKARAKKND